MSGAAAATDRLKRLTQGRRPYKAYNYLVHVLGPVGSWAFCERVGQEGTSEDARSVGGTGLVHTLGISGQQTVPQVLDALRASDEHHEAAQSDPLGNELWQESSAELVEDEDDPFRLRERGRLRSV